MRVIIVGGGLAGAATGYALARHGVDVLVCEREAVPGVHASGRSAGMLRRIEPDPVWQQLALEGARFISALPPDWPGPPVLRRTGGVLRATGRAWDALVPAVERARGAGVAVRAWSAADLASRIPALVDAPNHAGWWCEDDGVVDVHGLLAGLLEGIRRAGGQVAFGCHVHALIERAGQVVGVATGDGDLDAEVVVEATGAWAGQLAPDPTWEFQPLRRHLLYLQGVPWITSDWPWVWDLTADCYFRSEAGGLLASPCDEAWTPPGVVTTDADAPAWMAAAVQRAAPALGQATIGTGWAGQRTFAPDRRPVIGWDPRRAGHFWVGGLGGFGVTCAAAIGARAARAVLGEDAAVPAAALATRSRTAPTP